MVRVKLFANLREIVGEREIVVRADTIDDLFRKLVEMYPEIRSHLSRVTVVVNCSKVDDLNRKLNDDDVVALLPPFSGG